MMEVQAAFETLVNLYLITQHNNPETLIFILFVMRISKISADFV
jgi:hypothetical protein